MPSWLRSKLPAAIGGSKEYEDEVEQLTMDSKQLLLSHRVLQLQRGVRINWNRVKPGNICDAKTRHDQYKILVKDKLNAG